MTGLVFAGVYWWVSSKFGNSLKSGFWISLAYYLFLASVMEVIFVSDWLYTTILDEAVLVGVVVGFLGILAGLGPDLLTGFLAGFGAAGFFGALVLVTRGKGMGLGDVKFGFLMGLVLGWPGVLIALYLAFLTGATAGVIMILAKKRRFGQTIPFGPFLVFGTLTALFWEEKIWQLVNTVLL
jgi:prepilin signal peptidase PulO-like enzyme (type II secretory pathway)